MSMIRAERCEHSSGDGWRMEEVSGAAVSLGLSDVLFAEQHFQEAELSFQLFVLLVLILHGGAVLFLADSVRHREKKSKSGSAFVL